MGQTAVRMAEHYTNLLKSVVEDGVAEAVPLRRLRLMSEAEEQKVRVEWTYPAGLGPTRMEAWQSTDVLCGDVRVCWCGLLLLIIIKIRDDDDPQLISIIL